MNCYRCEGLMVRDYVFDLLDTQMRSRVWRCVGCGEIVDPVIVRNRMAQMARPISKIRPAKAPATPGVLSLVA